MLIILIAWVFWLMLHGRLATYAGFVTTANPQGGIGTVFAGWRNGIPVSLSLVNAGGAADKAAQQAAPGGTTTPVYGNYIAPNMPAAGAYNASLPASDKGFWASLRAMSGWMPSGLPNFYTLNGLNNQALANTASGAPGL